MNNKILILISCTLFIGCSKDFLDRKPLSQLSVETFYKTEADAKAAILACYSNLQGPRFYGLAYGYLSDIASDDGTHKDQPNLVDEFQWNALGEQGGTGMGYFAALWQRCFESIYRANLVLEKVPNIPFSNQNQKDIMLAEAKFFRALGYFHLYIMYGNAPIILKPATTVDELYSYKQETPENLYNQIVADLNSCKDVLPPSWSNENKGRVTKGAAYALLGKAHLYNQKWDLAKSALQEVINSGLYNLMPKFKDNFSSTTENNVESIFEIQYADLGPNALPWIDDLGISGEGNMRDLYYGIQGVGNQKGFSEVIALRDLYIDFEPGDERRFQTVYNFEDYNGGVYVEQLTGYAQNGGQLTENYNRSWARIVKTGGNALGHFFHIRKAVSGYTGPGTPGNSPNNFRVIRYADVLLMYAEACNELGDIASATTYLNSLRLARREGITNTTISGDVIPLLPDFPYYFLSPVEEYDLTDGSQESMRRAICRERRVELAFEYIRFFDLRRWDKIPNHPGAARTVYAKKFKTSTNEFGGGKNYIPDIHQYYPIPQFQIDLSNGSLKQNNGY